MIMSLERRFIFIHVYKNAGTSIKRALKPFSMPKWKTASNQILKRIGLRQFRPTHARSHMTAAEFIHEYGRRRFDSCFSFAFIRNPWDWEVSQYKYICKNTAHPHHDVVSSMNDFREYIRWKQLGPIRLQQEFVDYQQEQVVSFIGRFENLDQDFQIVANRIGLKLKLAKRNRSPGKPFQEYYDQKSRESIVQMYQLDIERFEYEFDSGPVAAKSAA